MPRGNFQFLDLSGPRLARLGALAEAYFRDDPPGALIKLRQFAEHIAKDVAARHGLLPLVGASFDDVLRALRLRAILPREAAEPFYHLKRVGNAAVHENTGTAADALEALKIARQIGLWFHRTYGGEAGFKPGPFVPPIKPLKMAAADDVLICVVGATVGKLNLGADCAIGRSVAAIRTSEATSADFIHPRRKSEVARLRVQWGARGKGNQGALLGYQTNRDGDIDFRHQRGVYALYDNTYSLLYVGQAGYGAARLYDRLASHRYGGLSERFTRFSWFGIDPVVGKPGKFVVQEAKVENQEVGDVLNHLEAIVIAIAEPMLNKQGGRFGKAQYYYQSYEEPETEYGGDFEDLRNRLKRVEGLLKDSAAIRK